MQAAGILAPLRPRGSSLQRMGDESLADRAAAGNDAAFTALYERYHEPLLGYCRSILLDAEDAHDATQSALENALRALPRRDPGRPLRPWLYRIAHNEAINIVRRRQPASDASLDPTDLLTVPGPEAETEQRSRLAQLVEDLGMLPERQRGALVMRELSGLSYDEIGLALGMSNDAARRAVFDARSALHDAADGRATECVSVRRCLSDGDRRHLRARGVRAHLRSCDDCARFERAMGTRQADLFALGPWLGGGGALGLIGLGGAGSGVLVATGGGAVGGGGLSWAGLPVALKGIAVTAVVATTGTAAIELPKTVRHDATKTSAQAAAVAPAAISPLHDARRELALAKATAERARRAEAARKAADARLRTSAGGAADLAASRDPSDAEAIVPARPDTSTTPPASGAQRPSADPPAHAAAISPEQGAIDDLEGIREQILAAFESAQALAATGTQAALAAANSLIQTTLGSVSPLLGDILGSVGLTVPTELATAPPPTTTTPAGPTVTNVLAPAQSVLDGVDGVLQSLLGRR